MTTTHELDCSDAARMLIQRMQTHPEDFNYGGKLYHSFESKKVSARDDKALRAAHDLYILEPRLMVHVLEALLAQPKKEEMLVGPLGITGTTVNKMWFDEVTDTARTNFGTITREQFEDRIQTHKSPMMKHIEAVAAAQIYNTASGRQRIERDN